MATLNHPDDPGAALKELGSSANTRALVMAMLTGGVLGSLSLTPTGSPTVGGGAQPFMNQLGQNLQAGVAKSLISTAINGGSLEDSLKNAITSAFIDTGAAQGAFAIGEAGLDGFTNKVAHAIAGCVAGAARGGASDGCAAGALGAAIGEASAEWYGKRDDTVQFAAMMSAIGAAVAGGDASQINLASQAGGNAAANNWLATRQKAQMEKELKAASSALDKARVMGTWTYTSAKQDALTASGIGKGLADSGWSDVKGITEFLLNPLAGLNGLKQIIASEDIRQQLGDAAFKQLDAKIERMKTALDVGGDQNAEQLGRDLGGLVWQVGSVVTGAAGLAKGGVALAQTGIRVGEDVLEGMAVSKAYKLADAEAIASAKQYNNFYADGASKLYPMGLKTTSGVVIKANPDKTTTVLGSYGKDTGRIINDELGLPKSMLIEGSIQPGSFNLLNTPDSLFKTLGPERFWEQVNKPWLEIQRNDVVALATKPDFRPFSSDPGKSGNLFKADGGLTGFGREIDYLSKKGYVYEPSLGKMVKP